MGDAVYELFIREMLTKRGNIPVKKLHKATTEYVNAKAQKEMALNIQSMLNDEELSVFKRGRNSRSSTVPKDSDVIDYRYATGFEDIIGYLYILGLHNRIKELISIGMSIQKT